jgi:hypothetical protein
MSGNNSPLNQNETAEMIDNRHVRFATIDGIDRLDVPLAAEVWLEDIRNQSWTSREIVKLAGLFVRYMARPNPDWLSLRYIDRSYQLDGKETVQALRMMRIYSAIEEFSCENSKVYVSLHLTLLQRLRVLEARKKFSELCNAPRPVLPQFTSDIDDKWIPENPVIELEDVAAA